MIVKHAIWLNRYIQIYHIFKIIIKKINYHFLFQKIKKGSCAATEETRKSTCTKRNSNTWRLLRYILYSYPKISKNIEEDYNNNNCKKNSYTNFTIIKKVSSQKKQIFFKYVFRVVSNVVCVAYWSDCHDIYCRRVSRCPGNCRNHLGICDIYLICDAWYRIWHSAFISANVKKNMLHFCYCIYHKMILYQLES